MRQSPRHPLQRCLTVLAAATAMALALQVPQGMADSAADPTLTQAAPGVVSSGGIVDLRDSLLQLRTGNAERNGMTQQQRQRDALQSALRQLSSAERAAVSPTPRLGRIDRTSAVMQSQDLASLAASLLAARQDVPFASVEHSSSVNDLRRAMGRFPTVTDTLLSDTFSGVLLGLADIEPTLSDELMTHPTVDKQALRERMVETRLLATGTITPGVQLAQTAPRLSQPSVEPVVAAAPLPASDDGLLAGLDQPMDTIALGDTMAAPQSGWDTIASAEDGLVAMEDTVDLDQIDLEELGAADIASAAVPVATNDLKETRAGFVLPNGMVVDFAVTRLTSIDGIDGLLSAPSLPAGLDAEALGRISARGPSSAQTLSSTSGGSMFSWVNNLQNMDDNRVIRNFTIIDIGLKNSGVKPRDLLPQSFMPDRIIAPEIR